LHLRGGSSCSGGTVHITTSGDGTTSASGTTSGSTFGAKFLKVSTAFKDIINYIFSGKIEIFMTAKATIGSNRATRRICGFSPFVNFCGVGN
jgi:hypothetical protein